MTRAAAVPLPAELTALVRFLDHLLTALKVWPT